MVVIWKYIYDARTYEWQTYSVFVSTKMTSADTCLTTFRLPNTLHESAALRVVPTTKIQICSIVSQTRRTGWHNFTFFMCCWPCILVIFDFVFQLNALLVYYIFSYSSTCFEPYCAHHQEDLLYIHSIWFFICHSENN